MGLSWCWFQCLYFRLFVSGLDLSLNSLGSEVGFGLGSALGTLFGAILDWLDVKLGFGLGSLLGC